MRSSLVLTVLGIVVLPAVALADGGPDLELSTVQMACPGPVVVRVHPDGSGTPFNAALQHGLTVDATVTLHLLDWGGNPIPNFPAEDIWLAGVSSAGDLVACNHPLGLIPDGNTDAQGRTQWVASPAAGGYVASLVTAYVNGAALASTSGLELSFVSPDINGSLGVDLTDAGLLSQALFGTYAPRADMNGDGTINVSDAGVIVQNVGVACP